MQPFMDKDFLLRGDVAKHLYHEVAADLPIIDYHCHLSPADIAADKRFANITEAWLYGDHYKWRAMRACGVPEREITGDGSDFDRFRAYASVMPKLAGNPLYHWSHLELRRYFGCDLLLNEKNCGEIWRVTAEKFAGEDMGAQGLIRRSNVAFIGTTDDPADDLAHHAALAASDFPVRVAPTFRPDRAMHVDRAGYPEYAARLSAANGVNVTDLDSLCAALSRSLDRFALAGCRAADHGMDNAVCFRRPDAYHANEICKRALAGDRSVTAEEAALFRTYLTGFLGREYVRRGMVLQMHFGVLRNPNTAMFRKLGADSGFDTVHGGNSITDLAALLDYLVSIDGLPRTVLYSVSAAETEAVATLCGAFSCSEDGLPRVVQGSAWWFNDRIDGMRTQMRAYAGLSAIGNFLGMLTDSRSVLSYPRHEYFRRIFCNLVGEWVEDGEFPNDETALAALVRGVCHDNAAAYFGI